MGEKHFEGKTFDILNSVELTTKLMCRLGKVQRVV